VLLFRAERLRWHRWLSARRRHIVQSDGTLGEATFFAEDGGDTVAQDKNGNVDVAAERVFFYSGDGKLLGRIDIPDRPIDLAFGGADRRTLYMLTHSPRYAVQTISGL
jgi:sugar lactone lactonase YvrE